MSAPALLPANDGVRVAGRWARSALEDLAGKTRPPSRVLLAGEGGTGKLHLARALHFRWHPDGLSPIEVVRCAGFGEEGLLAELFGREGRSGQPSRGLYWPGALERARGGTAILAHIEALSPRVAGMLAEYLDTGELVPLGGDRRSSGPCSVIATACSFDAVPGELLSRFPVRVEVPPLRERRADTEDLFWHFAAAAGAGFLPAGAAARFASLDWPGNVRELRAAVETEARRWLSRLAAGTCTREDLEREAAEAWSGEKARADAPRGRTVRARGITKKERILALAAAVAGGEITPEEVAKRAGASIIYTRRLLREAAGAARPSGT